MWSLWLRILLCKLCDRSAQAATAPFQQVNQANQALQTQMANLLHPTPTIIPDPVTYINEVRALARLETIQYSIEKVITGETGGGTFKALFGDKILFVASWHGDRRDRYGKTSAGGYAL